MPFGDGTGPRGMGSMTGRGIGFCGISCSPGHINQVPEYGFIAGMGRRRRTGGGRGIGRGRWVGRGYGISRYFYRRDAYTPSCVHFSDPRGIYQGYGNPY